MLTSRSEILLQVVLGAFLLGFIYVGVERLWIAKVNAQLQVQAYSNALKACNLDLKANNQIERRSKVK